MPALDEEQKDGARFLVERRTAILADIMGAIGKTAQAIAACNKARARRVLIISPNKLKFVWKNEVALWSPGSSVEVYNGKPLKLDSRFTVVNYEAVRLVRDNLGTNPDTGKTIWSPYYDGELLKMLGQVKWDVIILDEAHRIKNRNAAQTRAVKRLKAPYKFLLTGTPRRNATEELWSLLNFCNPKEFSSYWRFFNRYIDSWDAPWGKEVTGIKNPEELKEVLDRYILRRNPPRPKVDYKTIPVELYPQQRKMYNQMRDEFLAEIGVSTFITANTIITQYTRLKQIATDPAIVRDGLEIEVKSAKMDTLKEVLRDILESTDQKVAIFSQWARMINRIEAHLIASGIEYAKVVGGVEPEEPCTRFQEDPACRVFIGTIGAAGEGLTLTQGHIAIFTDRAPTPDDNRQAESRLFGRRNDPHGGLVIILEAMDTLEERIRLNNELKDSGADELGLGPTCSGVQGMASKKAAAVLM